MPDIPEWQPIDTAPADDRLAWIRWDDGHEMIMEFDTESTPAFWRKHGATHWRAATEKELRAYKAQIDK